MTNEVPEFPNFDLGPDPKSIYPDYLAPFSGTAAQEKIGPYFEAEEPEKSENYLWLAKISQLAERIEAERQKVKDKGRETKYILLFFFLLIVALYAVVPEVRNMCCMSLAILGSIEVVGSSNEERRKHQLNVEIAQREVILSFQSLGLNLEDYRELDNSIDYVVAYFRQQAFIAELAAFQQRTKEDPDASDEPDDN